MVVTRRTPAPPAPTSRTHSAQPVPRLAKKANPDAHNVSDRTSPLANGSTVDSAANPTRGGADDAVDTSPKSVKSKTKQKQKKGGKKKSGRRSTGLIELLFRGFLLWFTIYTLSVCPEDEQLKSPICRGLYAYRRLVIEPYIIPPVQQALAHPSVAPYIEKAKPYADYAVRTAKPVVARAQKEFETHVVPQWNKRVIPLYYQYAAPQFAKLEAQAAPYRSHAEQEYDRVLGPYVRYTVATLNQWQHKARPYVVLAAEKTYDGYQRARPYARPVWEKVKAIVAQLLAFLGEQRRQFVDPHVAKIWEHVKELSRGGPQAPSASQVRDAASSRLSEASSRVSKASTKISSTLSSVASSAVSGTSGTPESAGNKEVSPSASDVNPGVATSSEALPAAVAQSSEAFKSSVSVVAEKASSVVSSGSDALSSTASSVSAAISPSLSSLVSAASDAIPPPASSLASAAESAVHAPLEAASSVTADIPPAATSQAQSAAGAVRDAGSALSSAVDVAADAATSSASSAKSTASSASERASVTVTQGLASVADSVSSIVSPIAGADSSAGEKLSDPDLEAFKAELGLEEDFLAEPSAVEPAPAPVETPETDEEREARLRERAEKNAANRADIERRHTEWERQLDARIPASMEALHTALIALRKAAAADLKENAVVRKEIEDLVEDAEKFLRGAEKYMANLQLETKTNEEKKAIWERVVSKVDQKFTERLHQTEAVVNGWYQNVLNKELAEVQKVTEEIRGMADRAQADIGLDYAYLDDVTYQDWQRYHDLARRSERFAADAQSVQDGSHPSSPTNPVAIVIAELENDVEDVVAGFKTRLRKINGTGARAFGAPGETADEGEPAAGDETVSILPIEESALPEHSKSPADVDVPPVVIGRGKEEVEAALNRVADLEGGKTSSPGDAANGADSDAVVEDLKQEIVHEETSPSSAPLHQEL